MIDLPLLCPLQFNITLPPANTQCAHELKVPSRSTVCDSIWPFSYETVLPFRLYTVFFRKLVHTDVFQVSVEQFVEISEHVEKVRPAEEFWVIPHSLGHRSDAGHDVCINANEIVQALHPSTQISCFMMSSKLVFLLPGCIQEEHEQSGLRILLLWLK